MPLHEVPRRRKAHRVAPPTVNQWVDWLVAENQKGAASANFAAQDGPTAAQVARQSLAELRAVEREFTAVKAANREAERVYAQWRAFAHCQACDLAGFRYEVHPGIVTDKLVEAGLLSRITDGPLNPGDAAAYPSGDDANQQETEMKEPETVTRFTAAPEDYDGFGTRTIGPAGASDRGRPVREVEIPADTLDWQASRYYSGMFGCLSRAEFNALLRDGVLDPMPDAAVSAPTRDPMAIPDGYDYAPVEKIVAEKLEIVPAAGGDVFGELYRIHTIPPGPLTGACGAVVTVDILPPEGGSFDRGAGPALAHVAPAGNNSVGGPVPTPGNNGVDSEDPDMTLTTPLRGGLGGDRVPPPPAKPAPLSPQTILNDLVYTYGANLPRWPNYTELLKKHGLEPMDVTPAMLAAADQHVRSRYDALIDWNPPQHRTDDRGAYDEWRSRCNRYRIVRQRDRFVAVAYDGEGHDHWVELDAKKGNYPREYRGLDDALRAVEKYHCAALKRDAVESNRVETLKAAADRGLQGVVKEHKEAPPRKERPAPPAAPTANGNGAAPPAPKTAEGPAPKAVTPKGDKDEFGARVGTNVAKINACLSLAPKTTAQLAREAGLYPDTSWPHLKKLAEQGRLAKTEEGYARVPTQEAAPAENTAG